MPISDLKKLAEKENRKFLVLILWLIVGVTFVTFNIEFQIFGLVLNGFVLFMPLLIICIVLFLIAFFLQADIKELNRATIGKGVVLTFIFALIFWFLGTEIFEIIGLVSFIVSFISYIFITSIFSMYYIYTYGIKLDEKFYKMPAPLAFVARWFIFLAGIVIGLGIIIFIGQISIGQSHITAILRIGGYEFKVHDFVSLVPTIIIGTIIGLTAISLLALIFGDNHAFNAWLGLFILFSSIYGAVLMVNAFLGGQVANVSPLLDNPITYVILFIFDLFVILYTISALIGSKAEVILDLKIFKPIKPDGILIFLILCKVAYTFGGYYLADSVFGGTNADLLKNVLVFWLFIPLMIIMGLVGILQYGKIKRERKTEKYFKKKQKREQKDKEKRAKEQEKDRQQRIKEREKEERIKEKEEKKRKKKE